MERHCSLETAAIFSEALKYSDHHLFFCYDEHMGVSHQAGGEFNVMQKSQVEWSRAAQQLIGVGVVLLSGCASIQPGGNFIGAKNGNPGYCTPLKSVNKKTHSPLIYAVSPLIADFRGGVGLTVTGRGFRSGSQVFVGGVPCIGRMESESVWSCSSPPHEPGEVDVVVVNPDSQCDLIPKAFRYTQVLSVSPKSSQLVVGDIIQLQAQSGVPPLLYSVVSGSGTIDPTTGVFTAPSIPGPNLVQVIDAHGTVDTSTIQVRGPLSIEGSRKEIAVGGVSFLSVTGGIPPYRFFVDQRVARFDASLGGLTGLVAIPDVEVQVKDAKDHSTSYHLKIYERFALPANQKVEAKKTTKIRVEGGVPPYQFSQVSGLGFMNPTTGEFVAPEQTGIAVITVKDSSDNLAQMTVSIVPPLVLLPLERQVNPGEMVRFGALGGVPPYSYYVREGGGRIDSRNGIYYSSEVAGTEIVGVKDSLENLAFASIQISSTLSLHRISASLGHTCAVSHSAVKCWGNNHKGQLGDGSFHRRLQPTVVEGLQDTAISVATGYYHSCALLRGGMVKCWGDNSVGQLGVYSPADEQPSESATPLQVVGLNQGVSAISAGEKHTCAIKDSKVFCWGDNSRGQLGGSQKGFSSMPLQVPVINEGAKALAAGAFHTCAIVKSGVKCWGANSAGQLGINSRLDSADPMDVETLTDGVRALESKGNHTCALTGDALYCWGFNGFGQLGNRSQEAQAVPVRVEGVGWPLEEISVGYNHTCARLSSLSQVRCWGHDFFGQVGQEPKAQIFEPKLVRSLPSEVIAIGAGVNHTCALSKKYFSCWGENSQGQLGNRTTQDRFLPNRQIQFD
jgi:alpha-tubulin suppressor-like RCC1 family protein